MDVITGLAAISQAVGITKDLREIDRSLDDSTFKLKISDLHMALADAKVSLSDAKISLSEKEEKISNLDRELDEKRNGDFCPKCRSGRMQLLSTEPHNYRAFSHYGVEEWKFVCDSSGCEFQQNRLHDPHGAVSSAAKGR